MLNHEPESDITRVRGVVRVHVWKVRSTELADNVDWEQIVRFFMAGEVFLHCHMAHLDFRI